MNPSSAHDDLVESPSTPPPLRLGSPAFDECISPRRPTARLLRDEDYMTPPNKPIRMVVPKTPVRLQNPATRLRRLSAPREDSVLPPTLPRALWRAPVCPGTVACSSASMMDVEQPKP